MYWTSNNISQHWHLLQNKPFLIRVQRSSAKFINSKKRLRQKSRFEGRFTAKASRNTEKTNEFMIFLDAFIGIAWKFSVNEKKIRKNGTKSCWKFPSWTAEINQSRIIAKNVQHFQKSAKFWWIPKKKIILRILFQTLAIILVRPKNAISTEISTRTRLGLLSLKMLRTNYWKSHFDIKPRNFHACHRSLIVSR